MYILRGFVAINSFLSNIPNQVSVLGELSSHSSTFSREVGRYGRAAYPDVRIVSFVSELNDAPVVMDPDYEDTILGLMEWMFQRSIDGTFTSDRDVALNIIFNEFSAIAEVTDIGIMATQGTYWLPESITLKVLDGSENSTRLWFSDPALKAQYDLYEIVVVPPVIPLDDLHKDRTTVLALLASITPSKHVLDVETTRNGIPDTLTIPSEYNWTDKNDPLVVYPTPWTVITYGNAANNSDIIKETIVDYILANSIYPREDWEVIFPDLFLPTEYYLSPFWHQYSLPAQQTQGGLYSPVPMSKDMQTLGEATFYPYPPEHIAEYNSFVPTLFKGGLGMACVGHPRNRNAIYDFPTLWPKYVNISTDHIDFNRIPPATAEFITVLYNMMRVAETMTRFTDVPVGFSRVDRNGLYYLSINHERVQYLMLLKSNNIGLTP